MRLNQAIISGWIDNTIPGITMGGIEVIGMERPIQLVLKGNCWRDLAGTRLDFVNPYPVKQERVVSALHSLQRGVVGDMTASVKVKSLLISQDEIYDYLEADKELPFEWKNSLSLEWFSMANGRVLVETTGFEMRLSPHQWELDEEGDRLQRKENADTLEHFMRLITYTSKAESEVGEDFDSDADEFEWERRLRVRDTLEETVGFLSPPEAADLEDLLDAKLQNDRDEIVQKAYALQMDVMLHLGESFVDSGPRGELAMAAQFLYEIINEIFPEESQSDLERGYCIAMLKRSVDASNLAIAACNTLEMEDDDFGDLRADIFSLRDMMLDKVRVLRCEEDAEGEEGL